jgi:DNA-binding NtrC family response regulator
LELAREIHRTDCSIPLILATVDGSEELAIEALRTGLQDYVNFPCSPAQFLETIRAHLDVNGSAVGRGVGHDGDTDHKNSLGTGHAVIASESMREMQHYLARAAKTDCTVLITGETGKELTARFIHENSMRRRKPFVCINCAAIPDSLLESELFGHTRGAFTGAHELRPGQLEAANGGTVFLDEIGDMSHFAQAKILRVLETKEICRLGATQRRRLDLRFIAATHQDLYDMTAQKTFRQDLFFRLDVAHVHLAPLRERKDDIPLLVHSFTRQFSQRPAERAPEFSEDFLRALRSYHWPGNVRELKNVIENLFLADLPAKVGAEYLPQHVRRCLETNSNLAEGERELLLAALFSTKWNKTEAAEKLHWSRMTLYRKLRKHQIANPAALESNRLQ